jgi:hypothetical protein
MISTWKILDISVEGEAITHAKYHVLADDGQKSSPTPVIFSFKRHAGHALASTDTACLHEPVSSQTLSVVVPPIPPRWSTEQPPST